VAVLVIQRLFRKMRRMFGVQRIPSSCLKSISATTGAVTDEKLVEIIQAAGRYLEA